MTDFDQVKKALESGADPAMLCMMCPWDRFCITPPEMTSQDITAKLDEARVQDERSAAEAQAAGKPAGVPVGSLLTALTFAGKDTSARVCPVFALRLRSSEGRVLVDSLKAQMVAWEPES